MKFHITICNINFVTDPHIAPAPTIPHPRLYGPNLRHCRGPGPPAVTYGTSGVCAVFYRRGRGSHEASIHIHDAL